MPFAELSELKTIHNGSGVRIPPDKTVPLTLGLQAVRQLTTAATSISPSTRTCLSCLSGCSTFETGAFSWRLSTSAAFLASLHSDNRFTETISEQDAAAFLVTAILHDIGHWPYCHPIEDMGLPNMPRHEERTSQLISTDEITYLLTTDWGLQPERITQLIMGTRAILQE